MTQLGEHLFLNLEQVIPLPEAEELMIGIAAKEKEEHNTERGQATRHTLRTEFWHQTLEALETGGVSLYSNVSPSKDHWLSAGSGLGGVHYNMIFSRDGVRVEFVLSRRTLEKNKAMFDFLQERRASIEERFGAELEWRRLNDYKVSIIAFNKAYDGYDKANWPAMIGWLVTHIAKLEKAFEPEIDDLRKLLRTRFPRENA